MDLSTMEFVRYCDDLFISFDEKLHPRCEELCKKYNIAVEEFCEWLLAYKCTNKKDDLTFVNTDQYERYISEKTSKSKGSSKSGKDLNSSFSENGFSSPYTPSSRKRPNLTPESSRKKRILFGEDGLIATPVGTFHDENTPSGKYSSRKNQGEVVASNLDGKKTNWSRVNNGQLATVVNIGSELADNNFKYMFQEISEKVSVLKFLVQDVVERYKQNGSLETSNHMEYAFQDIRSLVGRICFDNEKQVYMEESTTNQLMLLSLNSLSEFLIFPGQIVALECTNPTGKQLDVVKFLQEIRPPLPKQSASRDLSLVVAAGPFSTGDVSFEPLKDLMKYLESQTPDICILLGPFIDAAIVEEKIDEDYEEVEKEIFKNLSELAERLNFILITIPSQKDFFHDFVYPQPPFKRFSQNIFCMPDPCTIDIEGLVIGATSTDILFHLNKEAVIKSPMATDRIPKLLRCLLAQQNYYPLYPASPDVNLDLNLFDSSAKMPVSPHILLTPSEFKCFIKMSDNTTCINPGKLAKRQSGGTFSRINVRLTSVGGVKHQIVEAEIIKI